MRGRAEAPACLLADEPRRQARRGARPGSVRPRGRRGLAGCRAEKGVRVPEGRRAPLGRGPARNGGGAGLAAEVAQPPPLPRPSLKKGCASRHFSSLKKYNFAPPWPGSPSPAALPTRASRVCRAPSARWLRPPPRRRPRPCPRGRPAPRCGRPAAPRASRGAPQRHVGGRRLPPPGEPAALALPVGPRAAPAPRARLGAHCERGTQPPPPPPRSLAGALPLLKRATVADAGPGRPGPRTCSTRPLRPTVRRPRARRRPRAPRRLWA